MGGKISKNYFKKLLNEDENVCCVYCGSKKYFANFPNCGSFSFSFTSLHNQIQLPFIFNFHSWCFAQHFHLRFVEGLDHCE